MTLVDSQAAAVACGVAPGTVRSWASRGLLPRQGKDRRGRTTYDLTDVLTVYSRWTRRLRAVDDPCNTEGM